jgi:hypothetical protein
MMPRRNVVAPASRQLLAFEFVAATFSWAPWTWSWWLNLTL